MSNKILYIVIAIALGTWLVGYVFDQHQSNNGDDGIVCTADAMQCPDGSYVGRSGSNCEFICP